MSRPLNTLLAGLLVALLFGCQPVAEAAKAKLTAINAKDEAPKADGAIASVSIDSVNYGVDRAVQYRLYDLNGSDNRPIGGSIVTPLVGGGAKDCCIALPRKWRAGQKVRVEWEESDRKETFPEHYVKELEIPRYETLSDLYVVFYPEHEVEVVVSVGEPGHPEWAGRIKQSPWNQCVADFGRKVCLRAIPKPGLDLEEMRGFCRSDTLDPGQCERLLRTCIEDYEDAEMCSKLVWDKKQ